MSEGDNSSGDNSSGAQERTDFTYSKNTVGEGDGGGSYPLPSDMAQQERDKAQQEEDQQQQQQEQQQSSESSSEQKEESSSEQKEESSGDSGDSGESKGDDTSDDQKNKDPDQKGAKTGASRENPESIPTAGGERLGEKHWGESKMVPDVPKKQDENVSSEEGQPDQQTKDNTAQNTGGGGDSRGGSADDSEQPKQGFVDKMKDKLGLNKSE